MSKVKIKVIKTCCFNDLSENMKPCPIFQVGQEFISEDPFGNNMPQGFCHMAWQSLFMPVSVLAGGGKVLGTDDVHIVCCNDGLRPVVFQLEVKVDDND